jgi:hypothetical protein
MKKLLLTLFFSAIATVLFAQVAAIQDFHEKFKDTGKYISVRIEGGLLKILSNVETDDPESEELLKAISSLEGIDLHVVDKEEKGLDENYIKKFRKSILKENFEKMMVVRDGDAKIDFLVKEKKGKITDLLMLIDEDSEFIVLSFSGEIDLAALAKLSDELDIKGAKHLEKIEKQ